MRAHTKHHPRPLRVLAADDSAVMRGVLRMVFQLQHERGNAPVLPPMHPCGVVHDGMEVLEAMRTMEPDVLVLDLEMLALVMMGMGVVLAQDEATSAVWGMPGRVVEAGLARATLPLHALAAICESVGVKPVAHGAGPAAELAHAFPAARPQPGEGLHGVL